MDFTTLTQPPWLYVLIAVVALVVLAIAWTATVRARRGRERETLRRRYGQEYERTRTIHGSEREAVADLKEREQLRETLQLRDLNDADRDLVRQHMAAAQYRFVEDPADALLQVQRVAMEVLRAKGYPVTENREDALRAFSVDHPAHAGTMHQLVQGRQDGDVAHMRTTFVRARKALQDITGITYVLGDATDRPSDLRVEHDTAGTAAAPAEPAR